MKYRRSSGSPGDRRFMIVALYAMRDDAGEVVYCQPEGGPRKPCYRDYVIACAAADALVATDGAIPQRPYFCRDRGHFHLTSRPLPAIPKPKNRNKTPKQRKAQRKRSKARIRNAATATFERWADPMKCGV